ncbi:hypothetical protein Angca_005363, partial [Angiostrongylus cantonensis]
MSRSDVCSLPKDRGPCDKYELRFYFNAELKECKYFFWGGCEGNGNNFEKVEECESTCGIIKVKQSMPTTTRTTPTMTISRQPPISFKTTQGIRITPSNRPMVEELITLGKLVDQQSTTAFSRTSAATSISTAATAATAATTTVPVGVLSTGSSTLQVADKLTTEAKVVTPIVHVAYTRAPPIPQMSLLEGSEDNTADGVNRCLHPRDPGNCRGQFVRWYWDNENKVCDVFTYTGCQGNGNNYANREECLAICHKEASVAVNNDEDFSNVCRHDVDSGECNGIFQRFAFDMESGECRPFTYGGCGGNGNNFATLAECRIKCQKVALSPGNLCEHDIEVGECSGVFVRFGYDKLTNDCRQFTYGGCGGNGNNFATVQECRNVCVKKLCNPNPQCDLARCQIVNDRNGCPFCSCPPVSQPIPPGLETTPCPEISVDKCKDPCILINNRKGCKDCVCPSSVNTGGQPPADSFQSSIEQQTRSTFGGTTETTPQQQGGARPPAMPNNVGPPSGPTAKRVTSSASSEAGVRQESVLTVPSSQKKQIEIDSKLLPPLLSAQLQEKCMQPVEPGPCKHFVDRWYFNSVDGTCHPFKYGGCAGNRNHFFTQKECEIHCARFLRITPDVDDDDDDVEEDAEFSEKEIRETPRRAPGVTQLRTQSLIDAENNRTRSPSGREAVSGHVAYGKKIAKVSLIPIDVAASTSNTELSDGDTEARFEQMASSFPTITSQPLKTVLSTKRSTLNTAPAITSTSRSTITKKAFTPTATFISSSTGSIVSKVIDSPAPSTKSTTNSNLNDSEKFIEASKSIPLNNELSSITESVQGVEFKHKSGYETTTTQSNSIIEGTRSANHKTTKIIQVEQMSFDNEMEAQSTTSKSPFSNQLNSSSFSTLPSTLYHESVTVFTPSNSVALKSTDSSASIESSTHRSTNSFVESSSDSNLSTVVSISAPSSMVTDSTGRFSTSKSSSVSSSVGLSAHTFPT